MDSSLLSKVSDCVSIDYGPNTYEQYADFKVATYFINETNTDVTVKFRNNLPVFVKGTGGPITRLKTFFTVKTVYRFGSIERILGTLNSIVNGREHFKMETTDVTRIHEVLQKAFNTDRNINSIDLTIKHEIDLRPADKFTSIYVHDLDLLLSSNDHVYDHAHPFSTEGMSRKDIVDTVADRKVSGVFIELIDNESNIKNRFAFMGKNIIEVPVRHDPTRASGVYYTTASCDHIGEIHLNPIYCSLTEAEDQLGLYKTKEEAMTGGNPELVSKADEERYRSEALDMKRQLDRERANHEQSLLESKRTLSNTEHELELLRKESIRLKEKIETKKLKRENKHSKKKLKRESKVDHKKHKLTTEKIVRDDHYDELNQLRKDFYEQRSHERKDTTEFIKTAAVVLSAGLSIYAILSRK